MVSICSTLLSIPGLRENQPQPRLAESSAGGGWGGALFVLHPPAAPAMASFPSMYPKLPQATPSHPNLTQGTPGSPPNPR